MFETRFSIMPNTFVVVGCGGTGSRLVPLLAQFLKTCPWIINPMIFLVDHDVVEEKNLSRQNFIRSDVGKNKALVLATRYSRAYDITMVPIMERVVSPLEDVNAKSVSNMIYTGSKDALSGNAAASMIISCVDSMSARRSILSEFTAVWSKNGIFLDGGNEDIFGQIMMCNPKNVISISSNYRESYLTTASHVKEMGNQNMKVMCPFKFTLNHIPIDFNFYALTRDQQGTRSCADLDQTMAINSLIANHMFAIIQNIMYSKTFNYSRLNVSMDAVTPEYMTLFNMSQKGLVAQETDLYYNVLKERRANVKNVYGDFKDLHGLTVSADEFIDSNYPDLRKMGSLLATSTFLGIYDYELYISDEIIKHNAKIAREKAAEEKKRLEEERRKRIAEAKAREAEELKRQEELAKATAEIKAAPPKTKKFVPDDEAVPAPEMDAPIKIIPEPLVAPNGVVATPVIR